MCAFRRTLPSDGPSRDGKRRHRWQQVQSREQPGQELHTGEDGTAACPTEESVARYLSQLDTADRQEPTETLAAKMTRLHEKLTKLKEEMGKLAVYERQMLASPDQQISLTDPDSRSMATSGRGSGVVGYNVQVAVDTEHHLIVAHEV